MNDATDIRLLNAWHPARPDIPGQGVYHDAYIVDAVQRAESNG